MSAVSDQIVDAAERATHDLLAEIPNFKQLPSHMQGMELAKALERSGTSFSILGDACSRDSSLGSLHKGWIQLESSGHAIQDQMLPILLVRRLVEGTSARAFLAECRAFAASGETGSQLFVVVAGVSVDQTCLLHPGIHLIPWADVPDCPQKAAFAGTNIDLGSRFLQIRARPGAAIRLSLPVRQVLFPSYSHLSDDEQKKRNEGMTVTLESVQDIVRCIVAQAAQPVGRIGSWLFLENKIARAFVATAMSYGGSMFHNTIVDASFNPLPIDGTGVRALFQKFKTFSKSDLRVLRIALDRISSAFCELQTVDRAIDLGIALEAMLLHDTSRDRGELKFRTAIRGAAFIGGPKEKRLETFTLLKAAYDHRSSAVHTGALAKKAEVAFVEVQGALSLSADIARRIIMLERFPKWDEDFVIGPEPEGPAEPKWTPFRPKPGYGRMKKLRT